MNPYQTSIPVETTETSKNENNAPVSTGPKVRVVRTNLYGKDEMFRIIALGEVTRLPILFVGVPGVAKTAVLMDYAAAMYDGDKDMIKKKTFVIELDEGTKNSEIKGRPDMKELLEEKRYVVEAPIADAEYVLINEVDKGSSGVRNTLLSVMREKALFLGHEVRDCKWKLFAGSCNEITKDAADAPFWDRFLIKYKVERVSVETMFNSWGGQPVEIPIVMPNAEDIANVKLNMAKMYKYVQYIHKDVSDRTIYQLPILVKAIKLIWGCGDAQAIAKSCELVCPTHVQGVIDSIEDKRVSAIKTKISQIAGMSDMDQLALFLKDLKKQLSAIDKEKSIAEDVEEIKEMLKKEIMSNKAARMLMGIDDPTENSKTASSTNQQTANAAGPF